MFICFSTVRADAPATEISFNFSVVGGSRRRQKLPPRQWLPCDPYDEERTKFLAPAPVATPVRRTVAKDPKE